MARCRCGPGDTSPAEREGSRGSWSTFGFLHAVLGQRIIYATRERFMFQGPQKGAGLKEEGSEQSCSPQPPAQPKPQASLTQETNIKAKPSKPPEALTGLLSEKGPAATEQLPGERLPRQPPRAPPGLLPGRGRGGGPRGGFEFRGSEWGVFGGFLGAFSVRFVHACHRCAGRIQKPPRTPTTPNLPPSSAQP